MVGSFQRAGDRLRITARIVDAATGECAGGREGGRPARAGVRSAGSDRRAVRRHARRRRAGPGASGGATARPAASRPTRRSPKGACGWSRSTRRCVAGAIADFERAVVAGSALRAGACRPRQRAVLAVRDVARAQPARRRRCWRARSITCAARSSSSAIWPKRTPRSRSCSSAPAVRSRRWPRRAARSRSSPATGATSSGWRMPRGARNGCGRWRARSSSIRTFRSRISRRRWCTSRAATLDRAESVLREGTIVQDRQANLRQRYPAKGLHWLLGLVRLARGDAAEALRGIRSRDRGRAPAQLYAAEFAMNAYDGAGFARLADGDAGAAVPLFRRALELCSRARAVARRPRRRARRDGDRAAADAAFERAAERHRRAAARRPQRRSDDRRSLPCTPSAAGRDEAVARAASGCWTRPEIAVHRAGRSRSSRCSRPLCGPNPPHSQAAVSRRRWPSDAATDFSVFFTLPSGLLTGRGPYRRWHMDGTAAPARRGSRTPASDGRTPVPLRGQRHPLAAQSAPTVARSHPAASRSRELQELVRGAARRPGQAQHLRRPPRHGRPAVRRRHDAPGHDRRSTASIELDAERGPRDRRSRHRLAAADQPPAVGRSPASRTRGESSRSRPAPTG